MPSSAEIFLRAFALGYNMIPSKDEKEYAQLKAAYMKAQIAKMEQETASFDPDMERRYREAKIKQLEAHANYYNNYERAGSRPRQWDMEDISGLNLGAGFGTAMEGVGSRLGSMEGGQAYTPSPGTNIGSGQMAAEVPEVVEVPGGVAPPDPDSIGVGYYAQGGAVRHPQTDRRMYGQMQQHNARSALPVGVNRLAFAEGGAVPTPIPGASFLSPQTPRFSMESALDGVREGIEYLDYTFQKTEGVPDPANAQRGAEARQAGIGSANPDLLRQIHQKIDPNGGMSEDTRNMATLAYMREFFLRHNMPNRARAATGEMIQTMRVLHNRYMAIAQEAAAEGDIPTATQAALKAYANIPDGKELSVRQNKQGGLEYSYIDQTTGNTISKGLLTPNQIIQAVTNHGMNNFDDLILASGNKTEIANLRAAQSEANKVRQEQLKIDAEERRATRAENTPDNKRNVKLDIRQAFDERFKLDYGEGEALWGAAAPSGKERAALESIARRVYSDRSQNVDADEAVDAVLSLVSVDPKAKGPEKGALGFGYDQAKYNKGIVTINGHDIKFPKYALAQARKIRLKRMEEMKKAKEDEGKPGYFSGLGASYSKYADAKGKQREAQAKEDAKLTHRQRLERDTAANRKAAKENIDAFGRTVDSAVGAAHRAVGSAADAVGEWAKPELELAQDQAREVYAWFKKFGGSDTAVAKENE